MGKQTFDSIRKRLAIMLAVCFMVSLTAVVVSADQDEYNQGYQKGYQVGYQGGLGSCQGAQTSDMGIKGLKVVQRSLTDYEKGMLNGYNAGYPKGKQDGGC